MYKTILCIAVTYIWFYCVSLTRVFFINIFQTEYFSAVKFYMDCEGKKKNFLVLWYQNLWQFEEKLKKLVWASPKGFVLNIIIGHLEF